MAKKIRQKLTSLQQRQLRNMIVVLLLFLFAWLLFAPNMGVWSLRKQGRQIELLRMQKEDLEQENKILQQEVERLENDMEYFEQFAREKHGLLREDEVIIDFGDTSN